MIKNFIVLILLITFFSTPSYSAGTSDSASSKVKSNYDKALS